LLLFFFHLLKMLKIMFSSHNIIIVCHFKHVIKFYTGFSKSGIKFHTNSLVLNLELIFMMQNEHLSRKSSTTQTRLSTVPEALHCCKDFQKENFWGIIPVVTNIQKSINQLNILLAFDIRNLCLVLGNSVQHGSERFK